MNIIIQISMRWMFISCIVLLLASCMPFNQTENLSDEILVDSILSSRHDSMFTHPVEMEQRFSQAQHGLTDSAAFQKLKLSIGYCRFLQGDFKAAIQANKEVLDFATSHERMATLEAICWNQRSILLQNMNQRDSVIACLHHAYDAVYRSTSRKELENICINLADQYRQKGNLAQAALYYRKALTVVDSLKTQGALFSLYAGLGQIYADLHNFKLAHRYFNMAEEHPEPRLAYDNYFYHNSLGNCYYFEEKYDSALQCFREAYNIVKPFHQPYINALVEGNMAEIFTLLNHYDSAHFYLDKSYGYFNSNPTANVEIIFYVNSLKASLALREGKLTSAYEHLSRPYEPSKIGPSYIYLHNKRFMEYYAQKGEYQKAYHYKNLVDTYDDSIRNVRNINNIAEIDFRYRQDTMLMQRNIQIAKAKSQIDKQHTWVISISALLFILLLLTILYSFYIRRKREKEYTTQFALVTRLRMENVKNRLSPHYIYNVLNTVMPILKQYKDLSHILQLFIQVLRDNLQISNQIAVSISEEINLVKNYIALRQETHVQTSPVVWDIDPELSMDLLIPSMCIQIPVENALKYAFLEWEEEKETPQITVTIRKDKQGVLIQTQDNGRGYDPGKQENSERGTGNGLRILYRTAKVLNTKNLEKLEIKMQTKSLSDGIGHGTLISVYVPTNYQFKF